MIISFVIVTKHAQVTERPVPFNTIITVSHLIIFIIIITKNNIKIILFFIHYLS